MYKLLFFFTMVSGSMITLSANSWISMWIGLEINLLSIIPLMKNKKNMMESEAAMKYFITQALASTILLFSIIMMMKSNQFLLYSKMINLTLDSAIFTKMGAAPFHFWFPEVMEGLNWINATIMMTWQKIAPLVMFSYTSKSTNLMITAIIASMLVSGIMGLNQTSLRKILAYSSINHIGWMIAALLLNQTIWTTYMTIYFLMTINMTLMFKTFNVFTVYQLVNEINKNKKIKILFTMNFLSLGGIPPFIGFFPKWITINELINKNMILLAFIMILMTLVTLFFYMRVTFTSMILENLETKTIKINQNLNKLMISNFILISSLSLCTLMFWVT
uniref:NADH-ubiquinone oxidoreductase chain 2 n=1 Tax=Bostrichoidea sp. 7 KM-2017 TaxID=2219281 RepID=A0A346RGW8_9COLE|nr:NADH dehydrogenase subunit 2 [Bostrichoidea sp. 7 KM-2017]